MSSSPASASVETSQPSCRAGPLWEQERRSSAFTLSDLELLVFPELVFGLVLANILSPRIWRWRDDPWFADLGGMRPYRRILRLKQYVMDHYVFNLDLSTWGLTTKERECERFSRICGQNVLQHNAFLGLADGECYFGTDLREHFGLGRYPGNVIPYWKTETVEAMDAYRHKAGFATGAGECVSLAALYAAALFVVARIPLERIYLLITPLHCQCYVDVGAGMLTNNRRVVTKAMFFNGTSLSARARRAFENEQVTVVAHESGWVQAAYPEATMDAERYQRLTSRLQSFLRVPKTSKAFASFLRHRVDLQPHFQLHWRVGESDFYLRAECAFALEGAGCYGVTDRAWRQLRSRFDRAELEASPIPGRSLVELGAEEEPSRNGEVRWLRSLLETSDGQHAAAAARLFAKFRNVRPRLPDAGAKTFRPEGEPLGLRPDMSREEVFERLAARRWQSELAEMGFQAYRDLNRIDAAPFLKAAVERNPVSIEAAASIDGSAAEAGPEGKFLHVLRGLPDQSVYDGLGRLAQPDEVWNFGRGDGAEKAVLLANILRAREPDAALRLDLSPNSAVLRSSAGIHRFPSSKGLRRQTWKVP